MSKQRIYGFDIAKGIGMLCIIAGHMECEPINKLVFPFHVPLFFLISGYFMSTNDSFAEYAKKRVRDLLMPYGFACVLLMIANVLVDFIWYYPGKIPSDLLSLFIREIYASGTDLNHTFWGIEQIGAIWFLPALLWSLLLVKSVVKNKYAFPILLAVAAVSYATSFLFWLPFSIQAGGTAALFVYAGVWLKKREFSFTKPNYLLFAVGILTLVLEYYFNVRVAVVYNYYPYTLLSMIGALLISYAVIELSMFLEKIPVIKEFLVYVGANSVWILCFHIVELTFLPWYMIYGILGARGVPIILQYLSVFCMKTALSIILTYITMRIGFLRKLLCHK